MRAVLCLWFWLAITSALQAQQECPLPPALKPVPASANIFSEQQESDLGDVMSDTLLHDLDVVRDDALASHLRQLGARLTQYLPPTQFRYRFSLVDLSVTNAFSLPGGRVYISRKVVALARSDDELAGVLAHELGHIVTRQLAVTMTRAFRDVLGVNQVGDRSDIYKKYFEYLDTYRQKPQKRVTRDQEEEHQYIADQVALYAMARAGFAPQAYADVLDRLEETHGKTGSWFSELFGTTSLSQHRLRELLRNMATMPSKCAEIQPSDASSFQHWQAEVIAARVSPSEEVLPGLVFKRALALPLRPDIISLRFSPDAKYVLAQDDGGVHVLTRDPLAVLFFIDAPDSFKAAFSPDSHSIVVLSRSLRVETWDIATQQRTSVHEVLNEGCFQNELSPDGKFFGCLKHDFSLSLLDVASGEVLSEKKNFFQIRSYFGWFLFLEILSKGDIPLINMHFSPDGRYFLAGSRSEVLTYDLGARHEASLPGAIRSLTQEPFAFAGTDRIIGVNPYAANKSPLLRFPSGERIGELPLTSTTHVSAVAHGDYVLVWPLEEDPLGVMDLNKKTVFISFKHDAGDIYDDWILSERADGELALSKISTKALVSSVRLNQSRLGTLKAATVSPDFNRLAVSTKTRGAVWDLDHNIRVHHSRGFHGGWFAEDGSLYADFPKLDKEDRSIARLDPLGPTQLVYPISKGLAQQVGPYVVYYKPSHENNSERKDCTVEVHDLRTQRVLWSRYFPHEVPDISLQPSGLLMRWALSDAEARDELQKFPDLKSKAEKEDYLFERFDFSSDTPTGKSLVKTNKNSFHVLGAVADGDSMVVQVSGDRVLLYSLTTGEQKGHAFGTLPSLSAAAGLFGVTTSSGELTLYDLANTQAQLQYKFPVSVAFDLFSKDGKRLFVLTRDQTAYVFDLNANR